MTRQIEFRGERFTVPALARRLGVGVSMLRYRLKVGWPLERAVTERPRTRRRSKGLVSVSQENSRSEIPLTRGMTAFVDPEDHARLSQYNWRACKAYNTWYARTRGAVDMHRLIMGAPKGVHVDHRDGNGLNNRKSNLRFATAAQNQWNRKHLPLNTSGFRGVTWNKKSQRWQAGIKKHGKSIHLGLYATKEEAAIAYDTKAREIFGEFANLNFQEAQ